ncbi:MAG: Rpn family recombination-promoting nuclease/putative transposase [Nostoc sp. DedVER02]|uniref:Rpn family recombination-promoting nuclease/putative transposase n=1 Tax=unclassified Nostoc TaxID=2593658 RepID=UPI002AD440EE|nr:MULTISPECIES: Rpn family recombination-promoting nuclease/putative transposase [unclassified Nostoc]MDZ7988817.1 Rpn family recombination-promoting nuclease/putative transposase [Nostoc sp. DedVER02]MDZ8116356.1 Rpn family recombination-promoting nuclease/putative transposase [Nostoc sp. DedVER01b]
MRRDTIFYKLFKQFPGLLFELVDEPPPEAEKYQFESVEVKETAFRIDGVFLPPADAVSKTVFFAEVQFQKDEDLYHRFFSELFLFLYRNSIRYDDWFGVIIFASRSLEPSSSSIHRALLESGQVRRVYLDELGDLREQPLGLGLMLLTNVTSETEAMEGARFLLEQARQQSEQAIIDLVTTIIVYKFSNLSREEIATMLGLNLEEPRAILEAKEEGREEGREEGERTIVLRLLNRRVGNIPDALLSQIQELSVEQLEALGDALLDFSTLADLERWLQGEVSG